MSFGHALYYPYINLTNKNWLKHAFLFWDKISRIVPSSVTPSDNEDVIRIRSETGFIEDYSPDKWVVSNTFKDFIRFLERFTDIIDQRKIGKLKDLQNRNYSKKRYDYLLSNAFHRTQGTYIHIEKFDRKLVELLIDLDLAVPGENQWENWVRIDNDLGFIYMTYLAKVISIEKSLPIVTDIEEFYSHASIAEQEVVSNYHSNIEHKIGNLLITSFVPKDINSVPIDKLIKIKEKYSQERRAFFGTVSELCQKIPSIDNKSALTDALNQYGNLLIDQTNQLKLAFNTNKIDTINKFICISVPSSLASLTEYIPVEYKPLGISAGIVYGLLSSVHTYKKETNQLHQNPLSYLISIQSELSGNRLYKKINGYINGFRRW